ncbi:hypothetical protein [Shewanella aestuarii]|uniref:Uncharacterized protein n=1 Tax=Shewanella aestuarii TaxID=1028752 RepID=A0A6G9QQX4_9GAMM|nr:hypothetical protein [Shewanella aestuarii]QIR16503.1 hypothetical protein HBH39_18680 [Shewanella aestuarii]
MTSALSQFENAISKKKSSGVTISKLTFESIGTALNTVVNSSECNSVEDRAHLLKTIIDQSGILQRKLKDAGVELDDSAAMELICSIGDKTGVYDCEMMCKVYPIIDFITGHLNDEQDIERYSFTQKSQLQTITRLIPIISRTFSDYTNERNLFLSVLDAIERAITYLIKTCNLNCDLTDESNIYLNACTELYISTVKSFLEENNKKHLLQDDLKQIRTQYAKNIGLLILSLQSSRFMRDSQ